MKELTLLFPSKNKYNISHSYNSEYLQYLSDIGNIVVNIPRYEDIFKDIILNRNCTPWIGDNEIEEYAMQGIAYFNCKELLCEFYELRKERRRKELLKDVENFFEHVIEYTRCNIASKYSTPLFWESLCKNTSLSEQFFERYIDYVHWNELLCNTNISEQFYEKYIKDKSQYKFLRNIHVSEQFINKYYSHIDKKWLYTSYNLPYTFIDTHLNDDTLTQSQKIEYLLSNPYINNENFCTRYKLTMEKPKDISTNPFPCNTNLNYIHWNSLCYNTEMTEQFFEKHFNKINWDHLIVNTNISPQFFKKYISYIPYPGLACLYDKNKNIILQYFSNITENTFEKYIERIINKEFNLILY